MTLNIEKQIENIDRCIMWIKDHKPEVFKTRFLQLIDERRKLRILLNAERNNPGIAAFGQSQVGKSYLMNCILQNKETSFLVDTPEGPRNFVEEINPIGGGQEATGVVTRFSSFSRNSSDYSEELPIRFRSLCVRDILLIICESYFNQFNDYTSDGEQDIIDYCCSLEKKYETMPEIESPALLPDDMLEMKIYFKQHINNGQIFSVRTSFFDRLAPFVHRIPISDYTNVFAILWHREEAFSNLFRTCMGILQRLHFREYFYLPITAVTHGGVKEDTIMSVSCLQLLFDERAKEFQTKAYANKKTEDGGLGAFTKSELCTVCSEVIIRISQKFLTSTGCYDQRNLPEESASKLPQGNISMKVLENTDLLDFPGARPEEKGVLANLANNKDTLMYSFLRGKVTYLFNKYNEEQSINILLYCHHQKNNDATGMQHLLARWVNDYVGDTPEKRAEFIHYTKVSPLFHIGTMWNKDLENSENGTNGNKPESVLDRWRGRFDDLLLKKCFHKETNTWVSDWNGKGQPFQNCYMLRDFKYSKQVYDGFEDTKEEQKMLISTDYYKIMRDMFIKENEKINLFRDAALSWDVSSSIGNDGSLYIIQQLSIVAQNIFTAREKQIEERFRASVLTLANIMKSYYVSDDTTELLSENIRKANGIFRELEFACQEHPDYFGHLLQALQFTEAESFKEVHRLIPELGRTVHETGKIVDYELIRKRCNNFAGCANENEMWTTFIKAYRFTDKEEANDYLKSKNISPSKLFKGETLKRKNSAIISDDLIKLWQENISSVQFMNAYAGAEKMDEIVLTNLVNCIITTAQSVNLIERIEKEITEYVDILAVANINEDIVADMIATTISDFVMDFGYRYLGQEQVLISQRVAKEQHLPCYVWTNRERKENFEEDEMTTLFNDILSSSERYTPAYEANYNSWLEYMYIAFVAHINVPDYDREANDKLKEILDGLKNS